MERQDEGVCGASSCRRQRVPHLALCFEHLVSRAMSDAQRRGKPYHSRTVAVVMQRCRTDPAVRCAICHLTNERLHVRRQRAFGSLPQRLQAANSKYLQIAHRFPESNSTTLWNCLLMCALCNGLLGARMLDYSHQQGVLRRARGEWERRQNSPSELAWIAA